MTEINDTCEFAGVQKLKSAPGEKFYSQALRPYNFVILFILHNRDPNFKKKKKNSMSFVPTEANGRMNGR